jgi:hypothetical protein
VHSTEPLFVKDILEKKEYLITFLRRHRKQALLPSMKKAVAVYSAGSMAFPELRADILLSMREDNASFKEIYSEKLLTTK